MVYLKVDVDSATDVKVDLKEESLKVTAKGENNGRLYEIALDFFGKVKSEESSFVVQPRYIEMKIFKVEEGYWDRLLKEGGKRHWLSVDWNKWKDEDESGDDLAKKDLGAGAQGFGDYDFGNMNLGDMGGMPGMEGLAGMGGLGGLGGMGGADAEEDVSDDELPDLEES